MTTKLGILGGGQLAKMMLPHAHRLGIEITILDQKDSPANSFAHHFIEGQFTNPLDIKKLQYCQVVTVEIEHVSIQGLRDLEEMGIQVFPNPSHLELIQNKFLQKEFFVKNNLPTAPFYKMTIEKNSLIPTQSIFKLCTGGYDGKGVWDPDNGPLPTHFLKQEILVENKVEFQRELSQIIARNSLGEIKIGPLVEMVFNPKLNLIDSLFMPARVPPSLLKKSHEIALKIVQTLNYVGVMAIEMFETHHELLVNEIAPRPHNSGHGTIEACYTDQFEQHLRAVMGLPLGDFSVRESATTVNVIGEEGYSGAPTIKGLKDILYYPKTYPHFYGKKICSPGRKMGHINILGDFEYGQKIKLRIKECLKIQGKKQL